jgi:hypothetical protein
VLEDKMPNRGEVPSRLSLVGIDKRLAIPHCRQRGTSVVDRLLTTSQPQRRCSSEALTLAFGLVLLLFQFPRPPRLVDQVLQVEGFYGWIKGVG